MESMQFSAAGANDQEKQVTGMADYLWVIWKRKISVLTLFILIVIASIIYNLLLPEIFEAQVFIKIGKHDNREIMGIEELRTFFNSATFLREIEKNLNLPVAADTHNIADKFKITNDDKNKSNLLIVRGQGQTPDEAVKIANTVTALILKKHQALFEIVEQKSALEIELIKHEQSTNDQNIVLLQQNLTQIDADIKNYQNEIKKREDAKSDGQGRIVEAYIELLAKTKIERASKLAQLTQLQLVDKNFDFTFFQKEYDKKFNTKMTSVEISAEPPTAHIYPDRTQNVKLFSLLAFFIAILYAFIAEFVSKNRSIFVKTPCH